MLLFKTVLDIQNHLALLKKKSFTTGFVPTMGALHEGHMALMKRSIEQNDVTIASIFVNPTQFNNAEDLKKYPRTIERDIEMLHEVGVDILFLPEVDEIYPKEVETPVFDFNGLDELMEGEYRPGHFKGVAQVVYRFLEIVVPTCLYLGQKDYQQWRIVQSMLQQIHLDIKLIRCPIERNKDGLAMSSRNLRLPSEARKIAPNIYKILQTAKENFPNLSISDIKKQAIGQIKAIPEFDLDYFEIVNGATLQRVNAKDDAAIVIACTAVYLANIRLIDNVILKE